MIYFDTAIVESLKSIGCKKGSNFFRYYLKIETKAKSSKVAIVIMKNPAKACIHHLRINRSILGHEKIESDLTINNVIRKLRSYKTIIILNLYALMSSNTKQVKAYYYGRTRRKEKNTLEYIIKVIKINPNAKIFCAWGQQSEIPMREYSKKVYDFFKRSFKQKFDLGEYTNKNSAQWKKLTTIFPEHASKW